MRADRRTTLAELEIDPLHPECEIDATLKQIDCNPPKHIREQAQEMGGDLDSGESYLAPRVEWGEEVEDEGEKED